MRFIRRLHCLNARARPTTHAGNTGYVNGNGISFANSQKGSSISNSSSQPQQPHLTPHHFIHSSSFLSFAFAWQLFVAHFFMVFTSSVALVPHRCLLTHTLAHTHAHSHTLGHTLTLQHMPENLVSFGFTPRVVHLMALIWFYDLCGLLHIRPENCIVCLFFPELS